jgi:acetyl-CoA carboxylase biotin carboxyl carrier protein
MDLNYIKKLVKLVSESGVDEIEVEEEGKRIRIAKRGAVSPLTPVPPQTPLLQIPVSSAQAELPSAAPLPAQPPPAKKYHEIKSPIVGTFYRAPAPDAAPFVQIGSEVEPGAVLCIVEAMKLMNEIESDTSGKIVKIMAENGQPVEYDQTLFLVEPA